MWPFEKRQIHHELHAGSAAVPPPRSATVPPSPDKAMTVAAIYRAVSILATSVQALPFQVHRGDDVVDSKLAARPDIETTLEEFLNQTVHALALHGNAYWWKTFGTDGQVVNLTVLRPNAIQVLEEWVEGSPVPRIRYDYDGRRVNGFVEHLRLNTKPGEPLGFGPLQAAWPDVVGAMRLREYSDAFFNVGQPVGVLSSDQFLNQEQATAYRDAWETVMRERTVAVLGNGMEYKPLYVEPKQAQMTEALQYATTNVCRLFGIPVTWMATGVEGTSLTYANTEQLTLTYLNTTLNQYLRPIEEAMTNCLPRGQEARLKLDALLRSDLTTRKDAYLAFTQMGVMSADEVRKSEGMPGPAPDDAQPTHSNQAEEQADGAPV